MAATGYSIVWSQSNWSPDLDLLAPGQGVKVATTPSGYRSFTGTSAAAPFVAGAFASIRSRFPAASVARILQSLQATGKRMGLPSYDDRQPMPKKRRIRIHRAAEWLGATRTAITASHKLVRNGQAITISSG